MWVSTSLLFMNLRDLRTSVAMGTTHFEIQTISTIQGCSPHNQPDQGHNSQQCMLQFHLKPSPLHGPHHSHNYFYHSVQHHPISPRSITSDPISKSLSMSIATPVHHTKSLTHRFKTRLSTCVHDPQGIHPRGWNISQLIMFPLYVFNWFTQHYPHVKEYQHWNELYQEHIKFPIFHILCHHT